MVEKAWQEDNGGREEIGFYPGKWEIGWSLSQSKMEDENLISNGGTREADRLAERSLDAWSNKRDVPVEPSGEKSFLACVFKMM